MARLPRPATQPHAPKSSIHAWATPESAPFVLVRDCQRSRYGLEKLMSNDLLSHDQSQTTKLKARLIDAYTRLLTPCGKSLSPQTRTAGGDISDSVAGATAGTPASNAEARSGSGATVSRRLPAFRSPPTCVSLPPFLEKKGFSSRHPRPRTYHTCTPTHAANSRPSTDDSGKN